MVLCQFASQAHGTDLRKETHNTVSTLKRPSVDAKVLRDASPLQGLQGHYFHPGGSLSVYVFISGTFFLKMNLVGITVSPQKLPQNFQQTQNHVDYMDEVCCFWQK